MRGRELIAALGLFIPLSVAAQQIPEFPLGTYSHVYNSGSTSISGWDPARNSSYVQRKIDMVANIVTYRVGLFNGIQPTALPYTLTPGSRGPAGCETTDTCECPADSVINNTSDVADVPQINITGLTGAFYFVKNCNFNVQVTVDSGINVVFWNSFMRGLRAAATSKVVMVDSLSEGTAPEEGADCGAGSAICYVANSEILGSTTGDTVRLGNGDYYAYNHVHAPGISTTRQDTIITEGTLHNAYLLGNTVEGFFSEGVGVPANNNPINLRGVTGPSGDIYVDGNLVAGGGYPNRAIHAAILQGSSTVDGPIVFNENFLLGSQTSTVGASWGPPPSAPNTLGNGCTFADVPQQFQFASGNTATDGTDTFESGISTVGGGNVGWTVGCGE